MQPTGGEKMIWQIKCQDELDTTQDMDISIHGYMIVVEGRDELCVWWMWHFNNNNNNVKERWSEKYNVMMWWHNVIPVD